MSRTPWGGYLLAVAVCFGCTRNEQPDLHSPAEKKPEAIESQGQPVISVGQSREEALAVLKAANARDITSSVGIIICDPVDGSYRIESLWFILQDGTCLSVLFRSEGMSEIWSVGVLRLGKKGQGYGEPLSYPRKYREIDRLALPGAARNPSRALE